VDAKIKVYEDGVIYSSVLCPLLYYVKSEVLTAGLPNILCECTVTQAWIFFTLKKKALRRIETSVTVNRHGVKSRMIRIFKGKKSLRFEYWMCSLYDENKRQSFHSCAPNFLGPYSDNLKWPKRSLKSSGCL